MGDLSAFKRLTFSFLWFKELPQYTSNMQLPIATTATLVVVSYIIYLVLASFLQSCRNARKARELKCEEPPLQKNKYPLGIDQIQKALAADKEKLFPIEMAKRTVEIGAITYRYSVLGNNNIFTADEKREFLAVAWKWYLHTGWCWMGTFPGHDASTICARTDFGPGKCWSSSCSSIRGLVIATTRIYSWP